jgi:outer membrane protein OmpA-like peptidoglycan-associated protein
MARSGAVRVGCAAVPKRLERAELDLARPRRVLSLLLTAAVVSVSCATRVRADALDLGLFLPPLGRTATFRIEQPAPDRHGTFRLGLALDYAHDLMSRGVACGARDQESVGCTGEIRSRALVADLSRADLVASLALFEVFELGIGLPIALTRAAASPADSLETHFGLADVRFGVGIALARRGPSAVGVRIDTTFPTASERTLSGSPDWSLTPALVATHVIGNVMLAAKLGYHVRERVLVFDIEQDDEFVFNAGAAWAATRSFSVITDASARMGVGGLTFTSREVAVEIDVGADLRLAGTTSLALALGTNALPVDHSGFAPIVRALLSVRGAIEPNAPKPVTAPRQLDSDGDGFADDEDACVYDAEDRDGFADDDGCPDIDNDADGLLDAQDACPDRSEDRDGFQDQDGCPEVDNDEDGVADGADRCRMAPEDRDGFEDYDGCPEPGPARPVVTLSGSRSLLADTIYFEGQADTINIASRPLLDELARTLQRLPPHKRVRVEGHTDDAGTREHNVDLSYRRAKAVVEYLKSRGVPAERLETMGYGGARPLADNTTPEGRALNRRVQFSLIDAPP